MIKKRQHYVCRYYLKPWSNKEQIYCIRDQKIFKANLMNIAQEKYFYELQDLTKDEEHFIYRIAIQPSPKLMQEVHLNFLNSYLMIFRLEKHAKDQIKEEHKKDFDELMKTSKINYEEDYHAHIEGIGNKYLDLIRSENIDFYYDNNTDDRISFLFFVTLQYMRTKRRRNETIRAFEDTDGNFNIDMRKVWPLMVHMYSTNMALSLHMEKEYKLILLSNQTSFEFITGDQPLINTYGVNSSKEVLDHNELEFYYPISPKLGVLITRDIVDTKKIIIDDVDEIQRYNDMIKKSSEEQIYASSEEQFKNYMQEN